MKKDELASYIGGKIKHFRLLRNMTQDDLAEVLNTTKQSIGRYENGYRRANQDILFELADLFKISIDDFFPNEEQSTTKQILDNVFSKLNEKRQEVVVTVAKEQLEEQRKENVIEIFSYNVHEKLSAGTGYGYFDDGNSDVVYCDKEYDYDFASWIYGDSMLPDYPNGDVALIKAGPFEYSGEIYAVDWDGQSYIKKVYQEKDGLRLVSTNDKYSDKFAPYSEEPRIIGKVVANFTPLEK